MVSMGQGQGAPRASLTSPCSSKQARNAAQRKISSALLCALHPPSNIDANQSMLQRDADGRVLVDVRTSELRIVISAAKEFGGKVIYSSQRYHSVHAYVPFSSVEKLAELQATRFIQPLIKPASNFSH
jgi:hypothetical protein